MKENQDAILYLWYRVSSTLNERLSKLTSLPPWAKSRYGSVEELKQVYLDRLKFEFETIRDMGFCSYFLIVADGIEWCRAEKPDAPVIPVGPGRGSAAGCLCTFLLGITEVDPIKYNLLFERFLNPDRISMPDIDTDYSQEHRHHVKEYFARKYGTDKVSSIGTFSTMKVRGAIKDIVRSMNLAGNASDSFKLADTIAKTLEDEDENLTFAAARENEQFRRYLDQYPVLTHRIQQYENIIRQMSMHAAGVLISSSPFDEKLPMMVDKKGMTVTACDGPTVEKLGYLKLDTLGLKNLDVIESCKKNIQQTRGKKPRAGMPTAIAIDIDPTQSLEVVKQQVEALPPGPLKMASKAYQLLREGKTLGIFQCEMSVTADLLKRGMVNSIEGIADVIALIRPGPRKAGSTEVYLARKKNEQPYEDWYRYPIDDLPKPLLSVENLKDILIKYLDSGQDSLIESLGSLDKAHSIVDGALGKGDFLSKAPTVCHWLSRLEDPERDYFELEQISSICDGTQGLPLFQEQLMQIAVKCAGFTKGQSDTLRKGVGKKNAKVIKEVGDLFMKGMIKTSKVSENEARFLWYKFILPYGSYGFNLSHSISYSFISYETAFLKANYPAEFYAALLSHEASQDKINYIIAEAKSMGIKFLPPRINQSTHKFEIVDENTIVYALTLMKGVGDKAVEKIVQNRPFTNMVDFIGRADCNASTTKILMKAGAFKDAFPGEEISRKNYYDFFEDCRTRLKRQTERLLKEGLLKKYGLKLQKGELDDEGNKLTPGKWFERVLATNEAFRLEWEAGQLEEIRNFEYDWENPIKVSNKGVAQAVERESGDDRDEWTQEEIFDFEEEIFGTTISGHRLDSYREAEERFEAFLRDTGQTRYFVTNSLDNYRADDDVFMFGLALQAPTNDGGISKTPYAKDKKKFTRRFYFADQTGKMQLTMFDGTYEKVAKDFGDKLNCISILEKKLPYRPVLVIKCKINDWNGRRSLIVQDVVNWANRDEILFKIEQDRERELKLEEIKIARALEQQEEGESDDTDNELDQSS